ncbi:MAG: P1 family peptidase, partial [Thermoplasmata archaeon]
AGAVLYDLPSMPGSIPDYLPLGLAAAQTASRAPVPLGRVGAGRGARVGKYRGSGHSMPGGQASTAVALDRSHRVGLLAVFNSVGAIRDPETGRWLAGSTGPGDRIEPPGRGPARDLARAGRGTILGIVATDLPVGRKVLLAIADHVHDGFARVVVPAHTATEGDTVFAASTASEELPPRAEERPGAWADRIGFLAEELVAEAARSLFCGRAGAECPPTGAPRRPGGATPPGAGLPRAGRVGVSSRRRARGSGPPET